MSEQIVVRHIGSSTLSGTRQEFAQEVVKLGRHSNNDIIFDFEKDRLVSGFHAELVVQAGQLVVRDVGSRNGTFVNGSKVEGEAPLVSGDVLRLGDVGPEMSVELRTAGGAEDTQRSMGDATMYTDGAAKQYIGQRTLNEVIETVVSAERSRTHRILAVTVAGFLTVGLAAVLFYWYSQQRLTSDVSDAKQALAELRGKHQEELDVRLGQIERELSEYRGEAESKVSPLIAKLGELEGALDQVRNRQDLSEKERTALIADTRRRVTELRSELKQSENVLRDTGEQGGWAPLADRYRQSIFLCGAQDEKGDMAGIGTAFVIAADGVLATNAHVVRLLEEVPVRFVVQNETGRRFRDRENGCSPRCQRVPGARRWSDQVRRGRREIPALATR